MAETKVDATATEVATQKGRAVQAPSKSRSAKVAAGGSAASGAAKAGASKLASPAKQSKPKKQVKPDTAVSASKPAAESKPAKASKTPPATVAEGKGRQKMVRDSFTMPRGDYELIAQLKQRSLARQRVVKKSELLRAGLHALSALSDVQLTGRLDALAPIKTGRPKKG